MKPEKLSDAIGEIEDRLIEETQAGRAAGSARRRQRLRIVTAAAACVAVILGTLAGVPLLRGRLAAEDPGAAAVSDRPAESHDPAVQPVAGEGKVLAEAVYPTMTVYDPEGENWDSWRRDQQKQLDQSAGYADGMAGFNQKVLLQLLTGEREANRVCSPLNLYAALSMLAECTGGGTQRQVLELLGVGELTALRGKLHALWNANYCDDGVVLSRLANSLWLNDRIAYVPQTLNTLAEQYYASSFSGQMGSEGYNALLRRWLSEQTDGLLDQAIDEQSFSEDTVLALASTICFQASWDNRFVSALTADGVFHAPDGDRTVSYMHAAVNGQPVYRGKNFRAVYWDITGAAQRRMWLLLPDEGVSTAEVLGGGEVLPMLEEEWEELYQLALSLPKFDVAANDNLIPALQRLGVTEVFESGKADFSPTVRDASGVFVSGMTHSCRVKIDEDGVTAAAMTIVKGDAGTMPELETMELCFDRPFVFLITGPENALLFAGTVAEP